MAVAVATTFDDNIYLTGFFSETDRHFRPSHVVAGEILGFTLLISISLVGSQLLATTIPVRVTGWLGLLPILIGLSSIVDLFRQPKTRVLDRVELGGVNQLPRSNGGGFASRRVNCFSLLFDRQTYLVSAITVSNGGNNLAIYIPFLGNSDLRTSMVTVLVCYGAIACWLLLSFRLTRLPGFAVVLSRYARRIFPFVLMWLGLRILNDSGALASSIALIKG